MSRVDLPSDVRSSAVQQQAARRAPLGEQFGQSKEAHKMHLNALLASLGIPSIDANSYWCSARTNLSQHVVKPVRKHETAYETITSTYSRHASAG